LDLLRIALVLAEHDPVYEDLAVKFAAHFAAIATAIDALWDDEDGFYYDRLRLTDGTSTLVRVHSAVGLIPLLAITTVDAARLERLPAFADAIERLERLKPDIARPIARDASGGRVFSIAPRERLARVAARLFDERD